MMTGGKWRLLGVRACAGKTMSSRVVVVVGSVIQCMGCMFRMIAFGCDLAFVMMCE